MYFSQLECILVNFEQQRKIKFQILRLIGMQFLTILHTITPGMTIHLNFLLLDPPCPTVQTTM